MPEQKKSDPAAQAASSMLERLLGQAVRVRTLPANWVGKEQSAEPESKKASRPEPSKEHKPAVAEENELSKAAAEWARAVSGSLRKILVESEASAETLEAYDEAVRKLTGK